MPQRGITLIEVVLLIVVLFVLIALSVPMFAHTHCGSRKTDCKNSLKQIGIYFALYESKFKAYPPPGSATWFGCLWQSDMATDGNLFRCAVRGKAGSGTHYNGLTGPGAFVSPDSKLKYAWPAAGIDDKAPPDLPIACDGDDPAGVPNHGRNDDRNILTFQGRVDVFSIGSPTEVGAMSILHAAHGWSAPEGTK